MLIDKSLIRYFQAHLLNWGENVHRPMPWKGESNPYLIWLSEVILQQTRVEQGWGYYLKFKARFPDVYALANAPETEVLRLWQGLGYYTRARNLHKAARQIVTQFNGQFPSQFEEIIQLSGIGEYTASAIASFAYDLPKAVLDGNVVRVLARFLDLNIPFNGQTKKSYQNLINQFLDESKSAVFNQAIMDFGALMCTPKNPQCSQCPLQEKCLAFNRKTVADRPVKVPKAAKKIRVFNFLDIHYQDEIIIGQRTGKDIWQNLFQFPMIESTDFLSAEKVMEGFFEVKISASAEIAFGGGFKQELTHQRIQGQFYRLTFNNRPKLHLQDYFWVNKSELSKFALPKLINSYLNNISYQLIN